VASLSIRVQLQITVLIGEVFVSRRTSAHLMRMSRTVPDSVAVSNGFNASKQYPSLEVSIEGNSKMTAHWPGQDNRIGTPRASIERWISPTD